MFAGHMVLGIFALASSVFLTCGIQAIDPLTGVLSLPWFLLLIEMCIRDRYKKEPMYRVLPPCNRLSS